MFPLGIGRPADKRAAHALPRFTLGSREGKRTLIDQTDREAISLPGVVRECFLALKAQDWSSDPAPWREVSRGEVEAFAEGDPKGFTLRKKLESRAMLLAQRALLRGDLKAYTGNHRLAREVPGWAWDGLEGAEDVWFHGLMQFDPQLPAEWQQRSGESVFLERSAIMEWIDGAAFLEGGDLPAMPVPHDLSAKPSLESKRLPPPASFVTLSEALSWIAFRFSMNSDLLGRTAIAPSTLSDDPERDLAQAIASLAAKASGGQIELRGKYFERHSVKDCEVLTAVIEPVRLDDFAHFDILHDGLRFGKGLTWQRGNNSLDRIMQDRGDCYRAVRVNRFDLLRHFPSEDELTRALFSPIPASLPDIGQVMRLDEALAILATGKPSNDLEVWANNEGELEFRSSSGDLETHRVKTLGASVALHGVLRDGTLQAYISPTESEPLCVPRLFWSGVNPERLDYAYRAEQDAPSEPILLSRIQFDQWRAGAKPLEVSQADQKSAPAQALPSENEIAAKMFELISSGMSRDEAAKAIRKISGFELVGNEHARRSVSGKLPRGRPKKCA